MQQNDPFDQIIERYYQAIYRYCYVRLGYDPHAADDCTQEVFLILLKKKRGLELTDGIGSWLYETADRVIKTYLRKQSRAPAQIDPDCVADPMNALVNDHNQPSPMFSVLTAEEYDLLFAYYDSGYGDKKQLAERYGMTLLQLYKAIHNIRDKLRNQ